MQIAAIVNLALTVSAVAGILTAILLLRPMVAQARVGREAKLVEYKLLDAMLAGTIKSDDPALDELLTFSRILAYNPKALGLTEFLAIEEAADKLGIRDLREVVPPRTGFGHMTPEGRRVAEEAERDLHAALYRYLVDGSRAWILLVVGRWIWHHVHRDHTNPRPLPTPDEATHGYFTAVHSESLRPLIEAKNAQEEFAFAPA